MNRFGIHSKRGMWFLAFLASAFVAGCQGGGSDVSSRGTGLVPIPPSVTSTAPANTDSGVPVNRKITATFTKAMNPATITTATFKVSGPGATPVSGTVVYVDSGATAIFTPASNLAGGTAFTATITTGAKDTAGNALVGDYSWTFTTGSASDTGAPAVTFTNPADGGTAVPINDRPTAIFSKAMDPATVTTATFTVTGPGTMPVAGTVNYAAAGTTAAFTPASNLPAGTVLTATVTTGAKDLAGNALASDFVWTFTTGSATDSSAPTVIATSPADQATCVPINVIPTATFSEAIDHATLTTSSFTLTGPDGKPVAGTVGIAAACTTAVFYPSRNLEANTTYTATITTGATDLEGNALASPVVWSFTTCAAPASGPAPVVVGTAGDFSILAKSGISNVPTSSVTGDIGVSPIAATAITGFALVLDGSGQFSTSSQVGGKVYAADYAPPTPSKLTTAINSMEAAYTDAAGRTPQFTDLGDGNIGGLTLPPGVYNWTTGVTIPTNVILSGGPNDVWIFQITGDLTMAANKSVVLSGGALPKNVFWQVAGGAGVALGAGAHIEGIVMTKTAINLGAGASVNGRLWAQTAVNINAATVIQPAP